MTPSQFIEKMKSRYLWVNIAAMVAAIVAVCLGVKVAIALYTHHGEAIAVPNIIHKKYNDAQRILDDANLTMVVSDTGYVKGLPPDCILEQNPAAGEKVKSGHVIYITINSPNTPKLTIPDVIDNASLREAMAKLTAMGFKLGQPQYIPGEEDWVYGITVGGRHVSAGDKVSVDAVLTIVVGNGQRSAEDSIDYIEPELDEDPVLEEGDDGTDNFEVVPESTAPAEQTEGGEE